MCLEDKFLVTLYNYQGPVIINEIADGLSITENALLSIVHRVTNQHPQFVTMQRGQTNGRLQLSPNKNVEHEVKIFLADGGFTAINEQELREYYEAELAQQKGIEKIKRIVQEYTWIKWAVGVGLTIAGSFVIAAFAKSIKNKQIRNKTS